ncbi:MAG: helix-hairpin-helix domain-containing protein [Pseudomonadota bacterium]
MPKAKQADGAVDLEELPNVGPATAADLRRLGIERPGQLIGQDPLEMYERLGRLSGARQDPCVLDVFLAVVRFMEGGPDLPWWAFTPQRKRLLAGFQEALAGGAPGGLTPP